MKMGKKILICIAVVVALVGIWLLSSATRAAEFNAKVVALLQQTASGELYDEYILLDAERQGLSFGVAMFVDETQCLALQEKNDAFLKECAATLMDNIDALEPVDALASEDQYSDYRNKAEALKLGETTFETNVRLYVENYDKIEAYQSDLEDLLETYKVNCEKCRGNGSTQCSSCNGSGSKKCSYCNGKGKKVVTWYSEGDWGEKSYSSYDCTSCGGDGRISCSNCNGGQRDCGACNGGFNYVFP